MKSLSPRPLPSWLASVKLWFFTNLLGAVGILLLGPLAGFAIRNRVDFVVFRLLVVFAAAFSSSSIPCAVPLFRHVLALPQPRQLWLAGFGVLLLWLLTLLPVLVFSAAATTITLNFLTGILPIAAYYLLAAYLATAYVYRTWLFRRTTPARPVAG